MDRQDVKTIADLERYIEEYADVIYVREQINGKWDSYSLAELPIEKAIVWKQRWLNEGRVPVRMKRESEL